MTVLAEAPLAVREHIKSRARVRDLGEVYTQDREVQAMLDLIPSEVHQSLTSRWLEPACGDGNFLEAILRRKLALVDYTVINTGKGGKYAHGDRQLVIALAHIYGVDIDEDNVWESRQRLFDVASSYRRQHTGKGITTLPALTKSIKHVLHTTIIHGNTLAPDSGRHDVGEYTVEGDRLTMEMHTLANVVGPEEEDNDLFAELEHRIYTSNLKYNELHLGCLTCGENNG